MLTKEMLTKEMLLDESISLKQLKRKLCDYYSDCSYCSNCSNCFDCHNCADCSSCTDCYFSQNQVNKEYVVFNIQLTKDELEIFMKKL